MLLGAKLKLVGSNASRQVSPLSGFASSSAPPCSLAGCLSHLQVFLATHEALGDRGQVRCFWAAWQGSAKPALRVVWCWGLLFGKSSYRAADEGCGEPWGGCRGCECLSTGSALESGCGGLSVGLRRRFAAVEESGLYGREIWIWGSHRC